MAGPRATLLLDSGGLLEAGRCANSRAVGPHGKGQRECCAGCTRGPSLSTGQGGAEAGGRGWGQEHGLCCEMALGPNPSYP